MKPIYYTPVVSKENIIEKCDGWLELFKEAYKVYKELATYPAWIKCKVFPKIRTLDFYYSGGPEGKGIELVLDDVVSSVEFNAADSNKDIFNYVIASVVDYYLKEEKNNEQIDISTFDWDLYTEKRESEENFITSILMLGTCKDWNCTKKIVLEVIDNHNLGKSSEELLISLKNRIKDQKLIFSFDGTIANSKSRYLFTKEKLDKEKENSAKVLKKTTDN